MTFCWYTKLSSYSEQEILHLRSKLNPLIIRDIDRFKQTNDRKRKLIGQLLIQLMLSQFKLGVLSDIKRTKHGKPYLNNETTFNLSHSGDYIALAFSLQKGIEIGVDIEQIKDTDCRQIAPIVFCKEELDFLYNSAQFVSDFFRLWTRKEAVLKADGEGFMRNPKSINCLKNNIIESKNYTLTEIQIDPAYQFCIASTAPIREFKIEQQNLLQPFSKLN